ncbi:MAG: hypothetical protein RL308_1057 [Bacteroidota bacterium]|jgi:adenylate kinase
MKRNITFIGGIHGVGKSTICEKICKETSLQYLSASKLIKWGEMNEGLLSKQVEDVNITQQRLLIGLDNTVNEDKVYLLDGHYSLFNKKNEIVTVPLETFHQLNPYH